MKFEFPEINKVSFETENIAQNEDIGGNDFDIILGASTDEI